MEQQYTLLQITTQVILISSEVKKKTESQLRLILHHYHFNLFHSSGAPDDPALPSGALPGRTMNHARNQMDPKADLAFLIKVIWEAYVQ